MFVFIIYKYHTHKRIHFLIEILSIIKKMKFVYELKMWKK